MRNTLYVAWLFIGILLFSTGYSQSLPAEASVKNSLQPPGTSGDGKSMVPTIENGIPLSLDAAIQMGLDNNPEIRASLENVGAARGRYLRAVSPSPAELSFANDYVPHGRGMQNFGEQTVGVSQTFEFPTNYLFRGSKYTIERRIAESKAERTRLSVVFNVRKAYYTVLALQEQVAIAQENLGIAKDFMRKAEVRYSVGEGTNLEKLMAKVSFTEAQNNVAVVKSRLGAAFAELHLSMGYGRGESATYQLLDSLHFVRFDFSIGRLIETAAAVNPQLKANRLQVNSCSVDKNLAWSGILPEFTIGLFNEQIGGDATGYYGASLSLGIPLWAMMDQRGKIIEASANEAAARAELKAVDNTVYTKTSAAFKEFRHKENQVQLYLDEILPQAATIYQVASISYAAGEISYIEFLQAQQTLINSKSGYTEALLSYNLSIVALEEAVGTTLK